MGLLGSGHPVRSAISGPDHNDLADVYFLEEQFPPTYNSYRILMRLESPDLCQTLDFYSAPDWLCSPREQGCPRARQLPHPPAARPHAHRHLHSLRLVYRSRCRQHREYCTEWRGGVAQNNVWAVGGRDMTPVPASGQSLIEHWNGTAWSVAPAVPTVGILNGVAARSSTDVWAVGDAGAFCITTAHPGAR